MLDGCFVGTALDCMLAGVSQIWKRPEGLAASGIVIGQCLGLLVGGPVGSLFNCLCHLFVSDKYGAFAMHDVERRDPRMRFVVRERLQRTIDYLALG